MYVWKKSEYPPPPPPGQHGSSLGTESLFLISLSRIREWGAQLLLINFATGLHGICNGSDNGMNPTAFGLGISAPPPPPFFEDLFTRTQKH